MRKTLRKQEIDTIFDAYDNQEDVLNALYKLAFPQWDDIKSLNNWPAIGKEAGHYIMKKFMAFDRTHHPAVFNGGLWMNNGFSTHDGQSLGPWDLSTDNCKVELMRRGAPAQGLSASVLAVETTFTKSG